MALGASAEALTAAFIAEHGGLLVSRVACVGNARTRDETIAELTGIKAGERLSAIDPDAATQRLLKAGIFSEASLSVDLDGEGAVVTVSVSEKWTFIPIPMVFFGSGGWSAGISLMEANFLGLRKTLAIGGSRSDLGFGGFIAYVDPRFLGARTALGAFSTYGSSKVEARYMDGSDYASFTKTTADAGLHIGYPSEAELSVDAGLALLFTGVSAADVAGNAEGLLRHETLALMPGIGLAYDARRSSGYRRTGPAAKVSYMHGFGLRGTSSSDIVEAGATEGIAAFLDGLFDFGIKGRYGAQPLQAQGALSGPGYRTLPQGGVFSNESLALYASLDLPFVEASWCVMTLGAFYEGGACATGPDEEKEVFHGPGLGYRLYLRNIAVPAVGIDAAYNVPAGSFVFSASVGLSF